MRGVKVREKNHVVMFRVLSSFVSGRRQCSSFLDCGLAPELCRRLVEQFDISTPTVVQSKSLRAVLEGRHVVINAETGSGKTLCYLLPSVQALLGSKGHSSPHSLVLVPTPDLAVQVAEVFGSLTGGGVHCSVVHGGSRLSLLPHTHLVVATPASLVNYDLYRLLQGVQLMCVDEADALLTGGDKRATSELLNTFRTLSRRREQSRQLLVTAATLPQGGPQTAGSLLTRWLPRNTLFITTDLTHHTVSSSHHIFTTITFQTTPTSRDSLTEMKLSQLRRDLEDLHGNQSRILVFTNTQSTAELVYQHLIEVGGVATPPWWAGHVRQLHGGMGVEERGEVVRGVREGEVWVLVATDLLSRGIDLPHLTAVIQFDFPQNSAHYLHRAGRTARAGKEGKVISYTTEEDRDLAQEVRRVLDDRSRSFQEIFSRNKMLRRKIKSRKSQQLRLQQTLSS